MDEILTTAARFASALDAEDYAAAADCLSTDCAYSIGGRTHIGPTAIATFVDRIQHRDLSGEQEALGAFFDRVGISREESG